MKTEQILEQIKYCNCGERATFEVVIMGKPTPMCSSCANKTNARKKLL